MGILSARFCGPLLQIKNALRERARARRRRVGIFARLRLPGAEADGESCQQGGDRRIFAPERVPREKARKGQFRLQRVGPGLA